MQNTDKRTSIGSLQLTTGALLSPLLARCLGACVFLCAAPLFRPIACKCAYTLSNDTLHAVFGTGWQCFLDWRFSGSGGGGRGEEPCKTVTCPDAGSQTEKIGKPMMENTFASRDTDKEFGELLSQGNPAGERSPHNTLQVGAFLFVLKQSLTLKLPLTINNSSSKKKHYLYSESVLW